MGENMLSWWWVILINYHSVKQELSRLWNQGWCLLVTPIPYVHTEYGVKSTRMRALSTSGTGGNDHVSSNTDKGNCALGICATGSHMGLPPGSLQINKWPCGDRGRLKCCSLDTAHEIYFKSLNWLARVSLPTGVSFARCPLLMIYTSCSFVLWGWGGHFSNLGYKESAHHWEELNKTCALEELINTGPTLAKWTMQVDPCFKPCWSQWRTAFT